MEQGAWRRQRGDDAEEAAARFLEERGYRIRARNFSSRYGEVDLIAEHEGVVAFVEVRSRASAVFGDPSQTITHAKRRRVVRTALHYLFENRLAGRMIRFDVISAVGRGEARRLEHLPDAFDAGM